MKKALFTLLAVAVFAVAAQAQTLFDEEITVPAGYAPTEVVLPPSPLTTQVLFIGGTDMVQTTPTYGNPAGEEPAKEWHDFIGFTPDTESDDLGWVSVNHEMILANDKIGDGGGMTVFKVTRDPETDTLVVLDQTLEDGRSGKYFNVDFVNTVGETGMNCGGISSIVDGRIWTAEEWFRTSTSSIYDGGEGVRDTSMFTINTNGEMPEFDGLTIEKYQNFNWMVEIDPRQAKAIRKQYNWGRQPFEGGVVSLNNRRVYLGPDLTGGAFFGMFIADVPGDFTKGNLYAYKHDKEGYNWVPIYGGPDVFLNHIESAAAAGATLYNRIEWVALDPTSGDVYWTETGNDSPGDNFRNFEALGGVVDPYHHYRAELQGLESATDDNYTDYYGRIWQYDVSEDTLVVYLEGGPEWDEATSPEEANYFDKHLSNPDGLNIMMIDGKPFMIICEDLNGRSYGRVPAGVNNSTCELWLLDMSIENPTVEDLIRIGVVPAGAEVTGAMPTPDGKSLLVNSQHPRTDNPFPYNHSLTYAIHGFDKLDARSLNEGEVEARTELATEVEKPFTLYPNPTTRVVYLNKTTDVAIYNQAGQRIKVIRNTNFVNVGDLAAGIYFVQNADGDIVKLSVQ